MFFEFLQPSLPEFIGFAGIRVKINLLNICHDFNMIKLKIIK